MSTAAYLPRRKISTKMTGQCREVQIQQSAGMAQDFKCAYTDLEYDRGVLRTQSGYDSGYANSAKCRSCDRHLNLST